MVLDEQHEEGREEEGGEEEGGEEEGGEEEGGNQEAVSEGCHQGVWWNAKQRPMDKGAPRCQNK